jgi:hypothetical protein
MTPAQRAIEDQLWHTALESVAYVSTSKALINENAKRFGISRFDAEKAMVDATQRVTKLLNDFRIRDMNKRIRKMKSLHQKITAFQSKLQNEGL